VKYGVETCRTTTSSALVPGREPTAPMTRGALRSETSTILTPRPVQGSDHVPT